MAKKAPVVILGIVSAAFLFAIVFYISTTRGNSGWYLSAEDIRQLTIQAAEGDGKAAMRLSNYFLSSGKDREMAFRWREVSALAGNTEALKSLGSVLNHEGIQSYRASIGRVDTEREDKLLKLIKDSSEK